MTAPGNIKWVLANAVIITLSTMVLGQVHSSKAIHNEGSRISGRSVISTPSRPKSLNLPERSEQAITGSVFVSQVAALSTADREMAVVREVLSGNVPSFSRRTKRLTILDTLKDKIHELEIAVVCDYMAIGSDLDYIYIPMTPVTAQILADTLNCILPTKKIVDVIYGEAEHKLTPQPIPPSDSMTTVPVFVQHTDSIKQQILRKQLTRSPDDLVAGHKKDIIISNKIHSPKNTSKRVVIYGWHTDQDSPIQPVFSGHGESYADYSHGVRLISRSAVLDGEPADLAQVLQDPLLSGLFSGEGSIGKPYYPKK